MSMNEYKPVSVQLWPAVARAVDERARLIGCSRETAANSLLLSMLSIELSEIKQGQVEGVQTKEPGT